MRKTLKYRRSHVMINLNIINILFYPTVPERGFSNVHNYPYFFSSLGRRLDVFQFKRCRNIRLNCKSDTEKKKQNSGFLGVRLQKRKGGFSTRLYFLLTHNFFSFKPLNHLIWFNGLKRKKGIYTFLNTVFFFTIC